MATIINKIVSRLLLPYHYLAAVTARRQLARDVETSPDNLLSIKEVYELEQRVRSIVIPYPLCPVNPRYSSKGAGLQNPYLAKHFIDETFGGYRLPVESVNLVESFIKEHKPQAIMEFGSGISTVCMAYFMREIYGDCDTPCILSIDQQMQYLDVTRELLAAHGLEHFVELMAVPIMPMEFEGYTMDCYKFDETHGARVHAMNPDFIFVDGPSGEGMNRLNTLPQIQPHLQRPAHFLLDDGLRQSELAVSRVWETLPGITLDGIYFIGTGIIRGEVTAI